MPLLSKINCKYLLLLFFYLLTSIVINSEEKNFTLPCQEKILNVSIQGSKTRISKLKKVIFSEAKMFLEMTEAQSKVHLQKILLDTGLFKSVKVETDQENNLKIMIEDTYTLLPIINFSTNLENFSYTAGVSESDLFNDMWQFAGAWSKSTNSQSMFGSVGVAYLTDSIQSLGLGAVKGDGFYYDLKKWYLYEIEDVFLTIRFKKILNQKKFIYGGQLRYSQFNFLDDPTLSTSVFASVGRYYRNHDIAEGYQFNVSARYLDDSDNRYTFHADFQKNWFIPIRNNSIFRGNQIDYHIDYSHIEDDRSTVGAVFSFRSGALHGLRTNSVFENNFGSTGLRWGVTSQKFLWTYWQPHIFMEAGISDHETYYSVGGGVLLTFPALYNSRLRIQYYKGGLPDSLSGIIISTTLDF